MYAAIVKSLKCSLLTDKSRSCGHPAAQDQCWSSRRGAVEHPPERGAHVPHPGLLLSLEFQLMSVRENKQGARQ